MHVPADVSPDNREARAPREGGTPDRRNKRKDAVTARNGRHGHPPEDGARAGGGGAIFSCEKVANWHE